MRRALFVFAAAGALAGPAAADVPPIVFSSTGPPDLVRPHRYEISLDGTGRREVPLPDGVVSPDGRLVARITGTDDARTIEVRSVAGGVISTIAVRGKQTGTPVITWSPDSRRLALAVSRGCSSVSGRGTFCSAYELWQAPIGSARAVRITFGRRPRWSADSTRLAFVRYESRFGSDGIFVIPAAGGPERLLAPGAQPVWAPHGTQIAYEGPRGLTLVDALDRHAKRFLSPAGLNGTQAWSPDGRTIAYVHQPISQTKPWHLETVDVRTRTVRVLAASPAAESFIGPIAWSHDSRLLAYATDSVTFRLPGNAERFAGILQLFVVPAVGGKSTRVTHELPWAVYRDVAFARDDLRLQYSAQQVEMNQQLYAVQPNGTGLVQLTHNLFDSVQPAWSPDGTRLIFLRAGANSGPPFPRVPGIYALDTATRDEHALVAVQGFDAGVFPASSPDGSLIAYVHKYKIAVARADGTLVRLISTHNDARRPAWSPDGSQIAFTDGGGRELLVVRADGTGLHAVAPVVSADYAAWSPDGMWIAFTGHPSEAAKWGVWVVHPDGTGFRLVSSADSPAAPAWSPDSSQLVYESYTRGSGTTLRLAALDGSFDRELSLPVAQPRMPAWRR